MDAPLVQYEARGRAVVLTLNRPDKLNALNVALFKALDEQVQAVRRRCEAAAAGQGGEQDRPSVVVLRGAGRCFSAGHDLNDIAAGEALPEPHFQARVIERLADLPLPVITVVHGHCYTGALELALVGDIILAAEGARFGDTHARWALTPIWGLSQRLPRRVGTYKAREMMFTCRTIGGREAEAIGLANRCVPDAELDSALTALIGEIEANSSFSHAANKRLLLESDGLPPAAGLSQEIARTEGRGPDMHERISRFQDKSAKIR